jgi:branched-chain amino acid transport system permease protein
MLALIAAAPFVAYPFFVMQMLCVALFACAFNLLIGYVGLLSFGHAMFFGHGELCLAHAAKVWGLDPELWRSSAASRSPPRWVLVTGALAIRSTGIYFAMITVALSQMVYFFCVEAPFTHGEDGIQSVPQGSALGLFRYLEPSTLYIFVAAIFVLGFLIRLSHDQLAVRRNPEGDPRERAARDLARLSRRRSTSSPPSCCRRDWPGSPARPRRSWCRTLR